MGKADELLLKKYKATPTIGETIKDAAQSFGAGTAMYPEAIANIAQMATELTPLPDTKAQGLRNYAQKIQEFYNPNEELQGTSWTQHPLSKMAQGVAGSAPTSVPAIGAGMLAGTAAVPAALFGAMAMGETYHNAREAGRSPKAAAVTGLARGAGEFAGEMFADIPLLKLLGGEGGKPLVALAKQMIIEGSTEGLQQLWQNIVEKLGYDKARPLMEGVLDSAIVGAGMGGMLSGAGVLSNILAQPPSQISQTDTRQKSSQPSSKAEPTLSKEVAIKPQERNVGQVIIGEKPLDVIVMKGEKAPFRLELRDSAGNIADSIEGTKTEVLKFYNALPKGAQPQVISGVETPALPEPQAPKQVIPVPPAEQRSEGVIALPDGGVEKAVEKPTLPTKKQPWEMSKEEWLKNKGYSPEEAPIGEVKPEWKDFPIVKSSLEHKSLIQQALSEGKPVPLEVLKDYPDLAEKYGKATQAKPKSPVEKARAKKTKTIKAEQTHPKLMENYENLNKEAKKRFGKSIEKLTKSELKSIDKELIVPVDKLKSKIPTIASLVKTMGGKSYDLLNDKNGEYFSDGKFLIADEAIANKLRNEAWEKIKKDEVKALTKKGAEYQEAVKVVEENIKNNRISKDANIPNYEALVPSGSKIKGLNVLTPIAGKYTDKTPMLYLTDGKQIYAMDKKYYDLFKKHFGDIELRGDPEKGRPIVVLKDRYFKGLIMPMIISEQIEQQLKEIISEPKAKSPIEKAREAKARKTLQKRIRVNNQSMSYKEAVDSGVFVKAEEAKVPSVKFNRSKYNNMTKEEQRAFDKKLQEKKPEYRLYFKDNTFIDVPKAVYEYAKTKIKSSPLSNQRGEVTFGPSAEKILEALSGIENVINKETLPYKKRAKVKEYKPKGNVITRILDNFMLPERWMEYQSQDTRRVKALLDNIRTKHNVAENLAEQELEQTLKVPDSKRIQEFLKFIDRNANINSAQKYEQAIENWQNAGKLTQREADALRARGQLRRMTWHRFAQLILEHRAGIKTTLQSRQYLYNDVWHNEDWFAKKGISTKGLQVRYKYSMSKHNPKTGKVEKHTVYLDNVEDIKPLVDKETYNLLNEMLPYRENYVSGARSTGTHWVNVYPKDSKEDPLFSYRGGYGEVKQIANALSQKLPGDTFDISVTPHIRKYNSFPLRTSPYDVVFYLNNKGIDINSEEAKKLIDATKSISNITRHLIGSKEIPGKSYKWHDVLREDARQTFSSIRAKTNNEYSRLLSKVPELIRDAEEQYITAKYIDILRSYSDQSQFERLMSGVIKPVMYGAVLWNSPTYIAQNLTEGIWAYPEAVEALNSDVKAIYATLRPLSGEEEAIYKDAKKKGAIPTYMPASELLNKGIAGKALAKTDIGRLSEKFSSDTAFKIGLKVATQLGITKPQNKMFFAARFVNKVKPVYTRANIPIGLLSKGMTSVSSNIGLLPFMRWALDMYSKVYGSAKSGKYGKVTRFLILSIMLAGLSGLPKKDREKAAEKFREWFGEKGKRFIENGLPGLFFDINAEFMSPLSLFSWKKWFSGEGNALAILTDLIERESKYIKKYGLKGVPMGFGAGKGWKNYLRYGKEGYQRKYGRGTKTLWEPRNNAELVALMAGFMPQSLVEVFEEQRTKKSQAKPVTHRLRRSRRTRRHR